MNTQFQLDPLGRLKQQIAQPNSHNKADPAVLIGRRYQYDTTGNLVRTDDQTNGSRDYTYDALGRITQTADEHYRYDPAHNLTDGSRISGNRLTQYQGTSYRYDPLGNLIEKQQHDGEIQHYRYNADNQLTEAEIHRPGQNAVLYRYRYDPIGRRIAKVHPDGSEIQYLWDGSRLLQEYRKDRTYTYVYTEDRNYEPLAQITTYNGSDKAREILYYHNDQIGIPREMTDEEGNIVWSGDYSGWGKLAQEGRLKLDIHQPFRLQNQHYDEETGLHYNFFRYYDPEIGRFTQQDPIKLLGGESLYQFAPNIQVWLDILGLFGNSYLSYKAGQDREKQIQSYGPMKACPKTPPRNNPDWKPYSGVSSVFHCGYEGFLEANIIPSYQRKMNECFYDEKGILVDKNHKYSKCGGTPDAFDSGAGALDAILHSTVDPGGILFEGIPAFKESQRHKKEQAK